MEVKIAVSKVNKYATSSSGDTVEAVERPHGGVSVVIADGQSSGRGAKSVSTMVVRKVISLLAEGVRDGAAARAASDYLFSERSGKVSSTLNILSVDKQTNTLVVTRNNPAALILAQNENVNVIEEDSIPVGIYRDTRPVITQTDLVPGLTAVVFTDGLVHAGARYGEAMDIPECLQALLEDEDPSPQFIADNLLEHAVKLDRGRPADDITVVVLRVSSYTGDTVRRMTVRMPLDA